MNKQSLNNFRESYDLLELLEKNCPENPIQLFDKWFIDATNINEIEPNAMSISTVNSTNHPSSRIVLLKSYSKEGFVFFTNYESKKGKDIALNNNVALLFWWQKLQRQVRIEGNIVKIEKAESYEYFKTRPKGSQIGALASNQSSEISRERLEEKYLTLEKTYYENENIPMPDYWGGYIVTPTSIEFWQGRPNRLHDRILYELNNNIWQISRLSP